MSGVLSLPSWLLSPLAGSGGEDQIALVGARVLGITSFVIAHRFRTIRSADQILVLNEGNI